MIRAATVALTARRNAPLIFALPVYIGAALADLTGYAGKLQVRRYGKAPGDPLLGIETASSPAEGIRFGWRVDDARQTDLPESGWFRVLITAEAIDQLPAASLPGEPATFSYDLIVTPASGKAATWMEGDFIVLPGVTE